MKNLPIHVVKFAQGSDFYDMFTDLFAHSMDVKFGIKGSYEKLNKQGLPASYANKEAQVEAAFRKEIFGDVNLDEFPLATMATKPDLVWRAWAVVSAAIDSVVPQILLDSIGYYADVHNIAWGDSAQFDIVNPRDFFLVSRTGRAVGQSPMEKQFTGEVIVNPTYRQISVGVDLYRVLAGQESLVNFVFKAARSLAADVQRDTYSTFNTALAALTAPLKVTGWSVSGFTTLAQKLEAWNGAPVVCLGTKTALSVITPSDANYRYDIQSPFARFGFMNDFKGVEILEMKQSAAWETEFDLVYSDTNLYLVSPAAGKLVKTVIEGNVLSRTSQHAENADLRSIATLGMSYGSKIATGALAGIIDIS